MNRPTTLTSVFGPLFLASLLMLTSCGDDTGTTSETQQTIQTDITTVTSRALSGASTFAGSVSSANRSNISTKVMGDIQNLPYSIGDFVEKGTVIVEIDEEQIQAQRQQAIAGLNQAKAALTNAEVNYQRFQNLLEEGSATQKQMDDVTMAYESAKAGVKAAENKVREINHMMSYTDIRAPFDGYVVQEYLAQGDLAAPGHPIIALEQAGIFEFNTTLPENAIAKISKGDSVTVSVPSAKYTTKAAISALSNAGNLGSRQFSANILLPEDAREAGVKSGMYGRVHLSGAVSNVVSVPIGSLVKRGQLNGVFTLTDNDYLVLRWIRTGAENNGYIEVLSGLKQGERIVAQPDGRMAEGIKIQTR